MNTPELRPYLLVAAFFAFLVGFIFLLAVCTPAATVVAVAVAAALVWLFLRGGPWVASISDTHPDAAGSLDVEHLSPPAP